MSAPLLLARDPRDAVRFAYRLAEAVQTPDVEAARASLMVALEEARDRGWHEVERVLLYADAVDAVVNRPDTGPAACVELLAACERDGDLGLRAAGLGMRAELSIRNGNIGSALRDLTEGTVLLEREGDALARVSGLISVAETYGFLNLWELADELYARAEALMPACEDPLLEPVTRLNRAFSRFWWAAGLFQIGDKAEAAALAQRSSDEMRDLVMPESWRRMQRVSQAACLVLVEVPDESALALLLDSRDDLVGPEVRIQVHLALTLAHVRAGRPDDAQAELAEAGRSLDGNLSPHQRLLLAWAGAVVFGGPGPDTPTGTYAVMLARQRWDDRLARLASVRAQINAEQLRSQHDVLVRRTLEDPLTHLGNRRALDDRLDELAATLEPTADVAMLVLDVDHFKAINDGFGHVVGDLVLTTIAMVLAASLRPGDVAVRLGGDEFCAVLVGAPRPIVIERAERIRELLGEQDWGSAARGLRVGVSVGAATGSGPTELAELYQRADAALYTAKQEGRGRLRLAI